MGGLCGGSNKQNYNDDNQGRPRQRGSSEANSVPVKKIEEKNDNKFKDFEEYKGI
jgi:hypothetical protein